MPMKRYSIFLKNCGFFARHGFFEEEAFLGQRFFVDAKMEIESDTPLQNDQLEGTVDYGVVYGVIEKVVLGRRRYLIEALATDIAVAVCERFSQIKRVEISVRKPNAPLPGVLDYVEVTVDYVP